MQASELAKFLQNVLARFSVDVVRYDYNRILEVKPRGINKGVTTMTILQRVAQNFKQDKEKPKFPAFILCIGDDRSDEDMFMALQSSSPAVQALAVTTQEGQVLTPKIYTCCVGLKPSNASHYLHDPQEVLDVVDSLSSTNPASPSFEGFPKAPPLSSMPPLTQSPTPTMSGLARKSVSNLSSMGSTPPPASAAASGLASPKAMGSLMAHSGSSLSSSTKSVSNLAALSRYN
eukprot:TRINITY_DN2217_c0_g1_i20.p1 TRINITY_DN2217_c0_g1~~TRINITY_DN2217_c0_g1_i20.p1  ORF type:complete len:232 (+),score=82.72 TRINITY_DN2217_c0_g1_i20:340-1035(+)